jgi:carbohydrate-selective porin OprB
MMGLPVVEGHGRLGRTASVARTVLLIGYFFTAQPRAAAEDEFSRWWNGQRVSGDLLGLRPAAAEHGLSLSGRWRGIYFGILESDNGSGNAFSQEVVFNASLDLAKALRWEAFGGLTAFGEGRWRDAGPGANPDNLVEADSLFNPSRYAGGTGWRMVNFGLRYAPPGVFGVDDLLTAQAGWLRPQQEFILQPVAQLFADNALASSRGLGGNIPFSSSFSTWGGTLEVKPVTWQYTKLGLFMSYPNPTSPGNHGLMFRGEPPENGLFFIGETGVRPELGASKLPGHYAFGGYFYGEDNKEFGGDKFGFYWLADQMLWREGGDQGLRMFSLFYFAPAYDNDFSFYVHGGFAYEGLVPGRDRDQVMIGAALGQYGDRGSEAGQTVLIEAGYRFRINHWSFAQPFAQYLVRPGGTDAVADAAILGVSLGVDF